MQTFVFLIVFALVFGVVVVVFRRPSDWVAFWELAGRIWFAYAALFVGLLISLLPRKPVKVRIDEWGIYVDQEGDHVKIAWHDVVWSNSSLGDARLVLEQRDDPQLGSRAAIEIDMVNFTRAQCEQIFEAVRRLSVPEGTGGVQAGITSHTPTRHPVQSRSWKSRSSLGLRVIVWITAFLLVLLLIGGVDASRSEGWAHVMIPLALACGMGLIPVFVRDLALNGRLTVTVDEAGVRLDRRFRHYVFAFTDIASVTYVCAGDMDASVYLMIEPTPGYYARTGQRPAIRLWPKWKIYQKRFKQIQFADLRSRIARGVENAGGAYIER
ncbi:MAG: hypothetical protein LBE83_02920 [Propionibacteriaceae bacterium]|nr:hypothetical protein [Propionibacteriaceae bacterium]